MIAPCVCGSPRGHDAIGRAVALPLPLRRAHPSEPGVVNYAVLGKGSVGNIVGGPMGWESMFTQPVQGDWVDRPGVQQLGRHRAARGVRRPRPGVVQRCRSRRRRPTTKPTSSSRRSGCSPPTTPPGRAFHRVVDRTVGCSGQTTAMHLDNGTTQVWSFDGGPRRRCRRELDQARSRHRSPVLQSNQAARKCVAAGQGLPIWQRRARGQRAGRGDAERAGSVSRRSGCRVGPCLKLGGNGNMSGPSVR